MHHKTLTHQLLQSLVHIINDEIQRKERNIWQKHYCNTNLKLPLQQWISHRINVEILKEKWKKITVLLQKLTYEINDKIYFPQELRNRQLLSCKISYKIQLKNLKYLHPQSLTCKVYQQQENQIKYLLPQSRRTRKIIDKMQQRK